MLVIGGRIEVKILVQWKVGGVASVLHIPEEKTFSVLTLCFEDADWFALDCPTYK